MKSFIKIAFLFLLFLSCSSETDVEQETTNTISNVNNRQQTGSSANDLLSDKKFTKTIVEVAYIKGFKPTEIALTNFKSFISNRTFKSSGVEFLFKEIPQTGKSVYSLNDIVNIEKANRENYNTNSTIAVWVLFVNGKSENDTNSNATLGSAYWNTSFVIYEETIRNLSDNAFEPERSVLETSVINHEFGHLLGLTNLGTNLQSDHEDSNNPNHCNVENCLMYYTIESSQGIGNMINVGQAPELDAQCLADLRANGGK